jgi:hypothetical protein
MDTQDIAAILGAIAWPITALIITFYFRIPLRSLLDRLADSLKIKSLKFVFLGSEVELTPEQAKDTLDEMLKEIVEAMNQLSLDEVNLFLRIDDANGHLAVRDLIPDFKRQSTEHAQLRSLRDWKLIRPIEGGNWQPEKHPIVTQFGRMVHKLHPKVSEQAH